MITRNRPPDFQGHHQFQGHHELLASSTAAEHYVYDGLVVPNTSFSQHDMETGSTDSGKPPSLSGKAPRPTSFRYVLTRLVVFEQIRIIN